MLLVDQMVVEDRAVGLQLAALRPPGRLHLAAAAPVASAVLLLPPGLQHLAVASAASLRQWTTLTPSATRPLLFIPSPTRLPPAWLPYLMLGLRRRTCRRTSACELTQMRTFIATEANCLPCTLGDVM